jgi:predicted permease
MRFPFPGWNRKDQQLDEEIQSHLQMATRERIERGESAQQAGQAARREFGNEVLVREATRKTWGWNWFEQFWQDVGYGLRMLRKNPGFTAIAVLTLALGIGANTAIFSVIDATLLKPLPYPRPAELVVVFEDKPDQGIKGTGSSYPDLEEFQRHNQLFHKFGGETRHDLTLTGQGDPTTVSTGVVTPEIFSVLEAQPLLGRVFRPEDGGSGAAPVVILSENLWRSRFGAEEGILGNSVTLDQRAFTVIGVMPSGFRLPDLPENQDVWIPLRQDPMFGRWVSRIGGHWLLVLGRMKAGVSFAQARAEMGIAGANLTKEFPAERTGWKIGLTPLQEDVVADSKAALLILWGAVGLVLLIACANVANLLLARATSREKEIAVRVALGAGRGRIVRQLLTESVVLGLMGGGAGILLAYWGVRTLSARLPAGLPQWNAISVDGRVLAFALLLAVGTSAIFGFAPALFAADSGLHGNLKESSPGGGGGKNHGIRDVLAVMEIALAMVLLIASGLLARSFFRLMAVKPGFDTQHLVKADISLPQFQYSTPQQWSAFMDQLLAQMQAQAGLRDSAAVVPLPLDEGNVNLGFSIVNGSPISPGIVPSADFVAVSPGYFRVMDIPILRGRGFGENDTMDSPRVALISHALARVYFPNQDPIGRQLAFGFPPNDGVRREIIGVVGDVRDMALSQSPGPMMYVPFDQAPFWGAQVVVKTNLDPSSVAATIRADVRRLDPNLPVTEVRTMPQVLDKSAAEPRFRALLLGAFGAMALLLSAAGVFGVISYSVSRRTREIGIRMALGARPADLLRQVLREGARLAAWGLAIGILAALALTRLMAGLLYGVSASDPVTFAGAGAVLFAVAIIACWIPARRAMRVEPTVALRYE